MKSGKFKAPQNKDAKFIQGIYNYCDRWCEYCKLSNGCFLYSKEKKRNLEHGKKGEDPHDMSVILNDVRESFKEAMELIKKAAEERGIDIENIQVPEHEIPDPHSHPLFKAAENYRRLAAVFLKRLGEEIKKEGLELAEKIEVMPSPEDEEKSFKELVFLCNVIAWYHTLISAKIYRALCGGSEESDEIDISDVNGSAKVAYLSLNKSINALQKIYDWNEDLQDDALTLLVEADRLRKGIDKEFSGHRTFKRPGFDK